MDGVSSAKPFVRKPMDFEEFQKQIVKADDVQIAKEGTYNKEDLVVFDPYSADQRIAARFLFQPGHLAGNENLFQEYLQIKGDSKQAISSYFDGTMSAEELGEVFFKQAVGFLTACDQNDYPGIFGMNAVQEQSAVEVFYSSFRNEILSEALQRNRKEGEQYVQGDPRDPQRSWVYYNSDYYYQSKDALSAVEDSLRHFAELQGYENFELPDHTANALGTNGLDSFDNFNTALFDPFGSAAKYLTDPDREPPENFRFFFQAGGSSNTHLKLVATDPNGVPIRPPFFDPAFDPDDPNKGTMRASFMDKNGVTHKISRDIVFHILDQPTEKRFNVFDLMQFRVGEDVEPYNDFLKAFYVYPKGYYSRDFAGTLNALG